MRDLGSLTLPCEFKNSIKMNALADSSASINLMLYILYIMFDLQEQKPTRMEIYMPNQFITYPRGIIEDLIVKVGNYFFPIDLVVLHMEIDSEILIILGRPFLRTARALVDIHDSKLKLRVRSEEITFRVDQAMEYSKPQDDDVFFMKIVINLVQEES